MSYYTSRRQFLSACASTPLFAAGMLSVARAGTKPSLHMTLTGQALMEHPLCPAAYAGFDAVVAEVRRGDVAFTDLEVAIKTAASGKPTRDNGFLHAAEPEVLGCLKDMGFDMLALSNNHAWDLSSAGVVATRDAVAAAGFAYAGTGANIAEAATPGYLGNSPKVALVAAASGKINELASATKDRSGVNELRLSPDGTVNPEDRKRILGSIEEAAINADYVIAYLHNHQWEGDMSVTRTWSRPGAGECVGAGADVYVSHGAPLLHGIEMFQGKPLLHSLGSLVFHSRTEPGYYVPEVWQSAIVQLAYDDGGLLQLEVVPVGLNEMGDDATRHLETRGRPRIATGAEAQRILERLQRISADLGTHLRIDDGKAYLA